jgi:hypothetical protein
MALNYGPKMHKVTSANIDSITVTGGTLISAGNTGAAGEYEVVFQHNASGCGGAESGIYIQLNDSVKWSTILYRWSGTGIASCWSFNVAGFGTAADSVNGGTGNLAAYNESLGDRMINSYLTWEVSAYQTHDRTSACDNNSDNFFIFNSGEAKAFTTKRRRNSLATKAGIHHGRSCNSTGTGAITTINNIRIY